LRNSIFAQNVSAKSFPKFLGVVALNAQGNHGEKGCDKTEFGLPESGLQNVLVEGEQSASDGDVGEGEALADQERLVKEVVVQDLKATAKMKDFRHDT
jgi:hypothetical protein